MAERHLESLESGDQKHPTMAERHLESGDSINSDEAVSSTNRLKAFISIAFYGPLKSLKTAAIEVVKLISEALVYVLESDGGLCVIEEFHKLLGNLNVIPIFLIGLHFQGLAVSPLHTHSNIILPLIVATIVYHITCMVIKVIKLQARDAGPMLRFICLVSGIIYVELLFAIFLSPFQLIKVHLYPISLMLVGNCLFYTANFMYSILHI